MPSGENDSPALFDCSLIHVRIRQHPVDSKFEAQAVLAVGLHGPMALGVVPFGEDDAPALHCLTIF